MGIGVPLGSDVRKVGNEPENVNVGATILMCLRNREIPDMVIETLPRPTKPAEGTMGPSNNRVLNRALIPAPVGPEHHLIAMPGGIISDRVEHQEPLPARSFESLNLKPGVPPPHRTAACGRLDHAPKLGLAGGIHLATKVIKGALERANGGCVT